MVGGDYEQPLFRPPSEARSLILQVTLGCSHNLCTFCSMYQEKPFRAKRPSEVREEIALAQGEVGPFVRRVFLADGNALCLSFERLSDILGWLGEAFPRLERVGIYANARDVLSKSDEELKELREKRLGILYLGLESGDEETLSRINKGATAKEIVLAVQRARAAGLATSVMVLVGLAGRARSQIHARASAEAINAMEPDYTGLLTYTPVPGSPLYQELASGRFELPSPLESLAEVREFVARVACSTYFTCNHASNYLPLKGPLPARQVELLAMLDRALAGQIALKPEFLRGL